LRNCCVFHLGKSITIRPFGKKKPLYFSPLWKFSIFFTWACHLLQWDHLKNSFSSFHGQVTHGNLTISKLSEFHQQTGCVVQLYHFKRKIF